MSKITILGSGRQFSSLDNYSYELSLASEYERIMLKLDRNQVSSSYSGNPDVYSGHFPSFLGSGWATNILLGDLFFRDLMKRLEGEVVHYTTFGLPLLNDDSRNIVTIHDTFFLDPEDEAYRRFGNISRHFLMRFRKFRNIVVPSEVIKKSLAELGFKGDIKVIYIPPPNEIRYLGNKAKAREILGLPADKKLVLSVSSELKRKNLDVVKKTVEALGSDYRLVRVGRPLGNSINFSLINPETMNQVYNACDVLLFPTLKEGFGIPVVEAYASGLPVVTSDIEIMREIAGDAALLVPPDVNHCTEGVKEAISTESILRQRGLERAKRFGRDVFKKNVKEYYSYVLSQSQF